ncbi:hypothetical protein MJD09_08120 [bacterium]|nr:hypothetical protein [bacterium]
MRFAGVVFLGVVASTPLNAQYLYKTQLLRAAPGKLLELIDLLKDRMSYYQAAGDEPPVIMRHSQGDHWDLLVLYPMGDYQEYYSAARVQKRQAASDQSNGKGFTFREKLGEYVAWNEEVFVTGPAVADVWREFDNAGFFHVEMFVSLPAKQEELYKQREMENIYLKHLGRPQNAIFVRHQGAAWDVFTIGFYRDLKHFAESADIPTELEEEAARIAGFQSASQISPYLRTLIARHNDTLAVPVR